MKEEDLHNVKKTLDNLSATVELIIREREDDPFSQKLKTFAQELSQVSGGKIILREGKDDFDMPGLPALTISHGDRHNIHYLVVPEGHELGPFRQALTFVAQRGASLSEKTRKFLDEVSTPAKIMVLVSPHCTNCPHVVEVVIRLASATPLISACIVDVQHFKELAEEHHIQSVPATIIDRDLVLIGHITQDRLVELLVQRRAAAYDRERVRSLLERGLIAETAELICRGEGREAILWLFETGDFSTRMGVLVVFEEALEKDPASVRGTVPQLIRLLSHEDARIRGDIADLLGKTGDPRAIPQLEQLLTDPDPDVVDAAAEALALLRACEDDQLPKIVGGT